LHALLRHVLHRACVEAERVPVKREFCADVLHDDGHMVQLAELHSADAARACTRRGPLSGGRPFWAGARAATRRGRKCVWRHRARLTARTDERSWGLEAADALARKGRAARKMGSGAVAGFDLALVAIGRVLDLALGITALDRDERATHVVDLGQVLPDAPLDIEGHLLNGV